MGKIYNFFFVIIFLFATKILPDNQPIACDLGDREEVWNIFSTYENLIQSVPEENRDNFVVQALGFFIEEKKADIASFVKVANEISNVLNVRGIDIDEGESENFNHNSRVSTARVMALLMGRTTPSSITSFFTVDALFSPTRTMYAMVTLSCCSACAISLADGLS